MRRRILTPALKAKLAADREQQLHQSIAHISEYLIKTSPLALDAVSFQHVCRYPNFSMSTNPLIQEPGDVLTVYNGLRIPMTIHAVTAPLISKLPETQLSALLDILAPGTVEFKYINGFAKGLAKTNSAIPLGVVTFDDFPAAARTIPICNLQSKRD